MSVTIDMRWIFTLFAAAFLTVGCQTVDRVERAEPYATPTIVDDQRIQTGSGLLNVVDVIAVREVVVSGDLLKIEVELENRTPRQQRVLYAFEWFDQQGMRLREPQWRTEVLLGRQRSSISAVANTSDAVDFRLQLTRGNP